MFSVSLPRAAGRALCAVLLIALTAALAPAALAADVTTFGTRLSGDNEVPPVATDASGLVFATFNASDNSLTVTGSFDGLSSPYAFEIGAHIHEGAPDENGPIVFALTPTLDGDNLGGTFNPALNRFFLTDEQVTALFAGRYYVNIHATANPGGELRGQLTETAKVQVVHNSPDPAARFVDVYVNGALTVDNLRYRKATPYLDVPAGPTDVVIASSDSNEEGPNGEVPNGEAMETLAEDSVLRDFLFDLESGVLHQLAAVGVLDPARFSGNPDGQSIDFGLQLTIPARATAPRSSRVAVNVNHGAPDAPTVRLTVRDIYPGRGATVTYGDVTNYYFPSARRDYIIDVSTVNGDNLEGEVVASFFGPARTYEVGGLGGAVMASGFLTPEDENQGDALAPGVVPTFRLIAVAPDGRVGQLRPAPLPDEDPTVARSLHLQALAEQIALEDNYPNPFTATTQLRFTLPEQAEVGVRVYDLLGRRVLSVAPQTFAGGGLQHLDLDASDLASGVYVYRLDVRMGALEETLTGRMTLLK